VVVVELSRSMCLTAEAPDRGAQAGLDRESLSRQVGGTIFARLDPDLPAFQNSMCAVIDHR
jgi:hypothetical protein